MRKVILTAAMLAMLPLSACMSDNGGGGGYGYDRPGDRRGPPRGHRRPIRDNDQIYRDRDGRYYCKRDDGTTGTIVGAIAGGVLGNVIAPGGSKTLGTILGGAGGALAGRAIDKNDINCE
jgi:outer membrane lipoprotein SlyB